MGFFFTFKKKEGNTEGTESPEHSITYIRGSGSQCKAMQLARDFYPDDLNGKEEMQLLKLYPRICKLTRPPGDSEAY